MPEAPVALEVPCLRLSGDLEEWSVDVLRFSVGDVPAESVGERPINVRGGAARTKLGLARSSRSAGTDMPAEKAPADAEEAHHRELLRQVLDLVTEVRDLLVSQRQVRDFYSTEQVAEILHRAHWTVREWCRMGRVNAQKRRSGRGRSQEWVISHAELLRIQREGLLPLPKD